MKSFQLSLYGLSTCFCLLLISQSPCAAQDPRKWEDVTGRFSVEAVLLSEDANTVHLKTADGRTIRVPKNKLSQVDLSYLSSRRNPKPDEEDAQAAGNAQDAATLEQALTKRLNGPPEPGNASESLPAFLNRLNVPYFIQRSRFHDLGLTTDLDLQTEVDAPNLSKQLNAVLAAKSLAWYRLRTVLVISTEEHVREKVAETFVYHFPGKANDLSQPRAELEQVEPNSWESLGGPGTVASVPPFVAVRNSPIIHRRLAEHLEASPLPHRYVHPLDKQIVSLQIKNGGVAEFARQLEKQLDKPVAVSEKMNPSGLVITVNLSSVTAADALNLVLDQIYCGWRETSAGLEITSVTDAEKSLERRRVAIPFASPRNPAGTLEAVQTICAPDSWKSLGGGGQIQHAGGQNFTVLQSQPVFRELRQLIVDMSGRKK